MKQYMVSYCLRGPEGEVLKNINPRIEAESLDNALLKLANMLQGPESPVVPGHSITGLGIKEMP